MTKVSLLAAHVFFRPRLSQEMESAIFCASGGLACTSREPHMSNASDKDHGRHQRARENRLSAALRANLQRRKAQQRERRALGPGDPPSDGGETQRAGNRGQDEGSD
jgi:hypothetical protein